MNKFGVRYTPECARLISKLPPEVKRLVRSAIDSLIAKPTAGTELTGEFEGYRSQRVRRYRIIYRINESESCIDVVHVGRRRDVYETLRLLLLSRD